MEEEDCSLPVTKTTTSESMDVCPTEDAIGALLENLVDPLLPLKPTSDVPSKELKESVAKQVHAVVLLYNYYHRRDHPHLECMSLESFRSLATAMRPALLQHLKESSEVERDGDSEQQTLLLEKAISDACSLSMSLNAAASDLSINLKKWPIRKVAVLLVDSEKQICYLQHSTITQGLWSLLEKPIDKEKTTAEELQNEEVLFQKVSFAAIKEDIGVSDNDIVILERHLAYSLCEEKTATRFYIMKCTSQANFPEKIPIEEMLNCMQGPLFEKSFSEWATNPIVEYFHLLPYASLIADWFSRREDTEFVIEKEAETVCEADATNEPDSLDFLELGARAGSKRSNDTNARKEAFSLNNPKARRKPTPRIQNRILKAKNPSNEMSPCGESYLNGVSEIEPDSEDHREIRPQKKKVVAEKLNSIRRPNAVPVSARNSNLNVEELQTTLLCNATVLSETALKVLLCKRDKLTLQHRNIEDEIAQCDKDIQNIKGVSGDWKLQLQTIVECCNDAYPRRELQESPDKSAYQINKRVKLSEPTKTSCQKLDDICLKNNWVLPNYSVSSTDGGFEAEIRIKESRFVKSIRGEEKANAEEARESAAACLLAKLQNKATPSLAQVIEMQEKLLSQIQRE